MNPQTQRSRALARAHEVRSNRARLYRELKAGDADLIEVLQSPPDWLREARIEDVLAAARGIGAVKLAKILRRTQISPVRRVGRLTAREVHALVDELRARQGVAA